jgi:hypothetical protein
VDRIIARPEVESLPKNEKISPTKRPSQSPDRAPAAATRPLVSRPVIRSTCLSSVPTIMQFCTGNSWSLRKSTDFWASSYFS